MSLENICVRNSVKQHRLFMWEVAKEVGVNDGTLSRWLRVPLTSERKQRIEIAIQRLSKEDK